MFYYAQLANTLDVSMVNSLYNHINSHRARSQSLLESPDMGNSSRDFQQYQLITSSALADTINDR